MGKKLLIITLIIIFAATIAILVYNTDGSSTGQIILKEKISNEKIVKPIVEKNQLPKIIPINNQNQIPKIRGR